MLSCLRFSVPALWRSGWEGSPHVALLYNLQDVSFAYERIPALRRLSLQIEEGESVALLGANGSGKSTLLRILDALYFPQQGSVSFCGRRVTQEVLHEDGFALSFRRRVALVFQN